MRKIFLLGALTAAASLSLGCALTDYPAIEPVNKSHGIIDCTFSQDRIANTQQTTEPTYRSLFFRDPAVGGFFGPFALTAPVDRATAREWGRFIGPFSAVQGAGVSGGGDDGQWEMAGIRDLADGSVRITTYFSQLPPAGFPAFSCGFGSTVARGASEGGVLSQTLPGRTPAGGVPGAYMVPQTVAIDSTPGNQWGMNIVALTPARAAAGYSTMVGGGGRPEYHVSATPVTRRAEASLGRFLNGSTETVRGPEGTDLAGWSVSAWGEMTDAGMVAHITAIQAPNGASYQAGETPVSVVIGKLGESTLQVATNPAETLKLSLFAREAGVGDQDIVLPEHVEGIPLPSLTLRIGADAIERRIDLLTEMLGGEGGPGFGG